MPAQETKMDKARDAARIEKAINYIDEHFRDQPSLGEIAAGVGLSEYHFQRLFRRWAGISPKRFVQFLTAEFARERLQESRTVLDAAYDAGLSSMGRLHDLIVNVHAMSPGELGARGAGLTIRYGFHATPFGRCLLASTERGICTLWFIPDEAERTTITRLRREWRGADLCEDTAGTVRLAQKVFAPVRSGKDRTLALHVKGTNFQIRVWEALLRIPPGHLVTYADVAAATGSPGAVRAAGTAVGRNPTAFLIPCHRVIRKTGAFGQYRWGAAKKKAIIAWENARLTKTGS